MPLEFTGFRSAEFLLSDSQLKESIREVQLRQNFPLSAVLISSVNCKVNLDIEMEPCTFSLHPISISRISHCHKPSDFLFGDIAETRWQ